MDQGLTNLADAALEKLVKQFADPFDCLRELVQNAMDAGTPRVEVWLQYQPTEDGREVVEIHIDDFGGGMDETIIDGRLTKMFASTKEDDLTKIGKFGIGFTSVFALEPDAVLLHTGRHGESWEVLFHPDRSFEKVRLDRPVSGTRVTMFKRGGKGTCSRYARRALDTLRKWCVHSDVPLWFGRVDRRRKKPEEQASADPFAAFAQADPTGATPRPEGATGPVDWQRIDRPMDLRAELVARYDDDDIQALVGYGDDIEWGFYNGGLTLASGTVSQGSPFLHGSGSFGFKVKYRRLEHTLTRDNVLEDEHYRFAQKRIHELVRTLRDQLLDRITLAGERSEDLGPWQRYLCREISVDSMGSTHGERLPHLPFRTRGGDLVDYAAVIAGEQHEDAVLMASDDEALDDALEAAGVLLLEETAPARALLMALDRARFKLLGLIAERRVMLSDELYVLPQPMDVDAIAPAERALLDAARQLIKDVTWGTFRLRLAEFGGFEAAQDEAYTIHAPWFDGPHLRAKLRRSWRPLRWLSRSILINRHHPLFRAQLSAWKEDPAVGLAALVQAVLGEESIDDHRIHQAVIEAAWTLPRAQGTPR